MKKNWTKILTITLEIIMIIIASFLVIRNVCYTAIIVNQSSMNPTLNDGDYGYAIKTKHALNNIKRFDIVIFKLEENNEKKDLIKRIIGLPYEEIEFKDDSDLYVNNVLIEQNFIDKETKKLTNIGLKQKKFIVPENQYFVLGDNRGISYDSRNFGYIEKNSIFGILKIITKHYSNYNNETNKYEKEEFIPFKFF